ncbi:hypothetical protein IPA_03765 [Ignicoccus pacificus DSM 13166]|uniref:Uncharacterized protein n=1 Tax=Ignicoccus pacificus DSM 13166 TaxID=940294 RepID=A0A977PLH6_9CREN|nr:hypothetical protein IPA_03765 [Ignicoccus pacificus DSM 13166]
MECVQKARVVKKIGDLFLLENDLGGLAVVPSKEICNVMKKLKVCIEGIDVKCPE